MYVRWVGHNPALAPRPSKIYSDSPLIRPLLIYLIPQLEWNVEHSLLWGRHNSHLVQWRTGPGDEIVDGLQPHSYRGRVADSSSSRHLSHMGSSVNPNLERRPFSWQCPVNTPAIHLNWSLFNLNRSFVLLAEGPFAGLSQIVDSHYFMWISVRAVLDCSLGNSDWDATGWFRSCERMFRSCSRTSNNIHYNQASLLIKFVDCIIIRILINKLNLLPPYEPLKVVLLMEKLLC
jgi:hypothetical protein